MKNSEKENRNQEQNEQPNHTSQKQVGQNLSGNYDPEHTILDEPSNDPESVENSGNQGSYDNDTDNKAGYQNQYQSGVNATDSVKQAQQSSSNNTQAEADPENQHHENGYGDNRQQKNVNENVEAANNDPLTNGHVVSNQDEKEDLREDVANDGTTTEGR